MQADGVTVDKYKARLVAKGFTQVEGVDFYETYAPVAKLALIRSILAIRPETIGRSTNLTSKVPSSMAYSMTTKSSTWSSPRLRGC